MMSKATKTIKTNFRWAFFLGSMGRENFPSRESIFSGTIFPSGNFPGGIFPGGYFPENNLLRGVFTGAFFPGVFLQTPKILVISNYNDANENNNVS